MLCRKIVCALIVFALAMPLWAEEAKVDISIPDLPDAWLVEVYRQAAVKNVLAAVNPEIFPGYWSVCADGQGFGYGNSYPSLDGHQLADAVIRLGEGEVETVKANWDYVKSFQRADGSLPMAIFPSEGGKYLYMFNTPTPIDANGGFYTHWAPGNPLAALADPTYIANATILFAVLQDKKWLAEQIDSVNLSATHLATMVTPEGRVLGSGFYIELPARVESDGVAQSHAIEAFRRVAALNRVLNRSDDAARFDALAEKMRDFFVRDFWKESHFAEYYSPDHGYITQHGLTDTDWAAIALDIATPEQVAALYPILCADRGFYYGTMPAGIATKPEAYEDWEFTRPSRHDVAAMGRVWYLTAKAHARMNAPEPLLADLKAVAEEGQRNDYYWRERYYPSSDGKNNPAGPNTYCEYPSNLIRIVQRFLLGVDLRLDGSIVLAPTVTDEYWQKGFGQEIRLPNRTLSYRFTANSVSGKYLGKEPLRLGVRFNVHDKNAKNAVLKVDGKETPCSQEGDFYFVTLQPGEDFVIKQLLADEAKVDVAIPDLPDAWLVEVYRQAAVKNVLAAVNPNVFPGYWSVCADGQGFGYGNSYPSLDGHQLADALIRLGEIETVKANWDYVKTFQRADGTLPLAIIPGAAGQKLWYDAPVDANGGFYAHWVPGNPLAALADPTYIANAEIIFAVSQDKAWLAEQIDSVNLSATHLATLVTPEGRVRGAGYYIERPTRVESDGVAQSHAIDAFRRVAALNRVLNRSDDAARFDALAEKIRKFFVSDFWKESKFAEYYSPEHGYITQHGLTDTDWAAIALGVATPEQIAVLYPALRAERGFYYGTMPAGIATKPDTYEDWEFTHPDRHDLGAMGRVWYLTAQARARMNDPEPLLADLNAVADEGRKNNYSWRERYHPSSNGENNPAGPDTYCEYPSNLIRIVQRFLLGVDLRLDGSIVLAPTVPNEYWQKGFGQEIRLPNRTLSYRFTSNNISGTYQGKEPLKLGVRFRTRETTDRDYRFVTLQPGADFVIERQP